MTKQAFDDFLKSFHKKAGEYSEEEIVEIGLAHKKVDNQKKNWEQLAKDLGIKNGFELKNKIKMIEQQAIEDIVIDNKSTEQIKNEQVLQQILIQKVKARDLMTSYRRNIRDEARIEDFRDFLCEAINNMQQLNFTPYVESKNEKLKNEAILCFSDLHIGVECDNFYNKYDINVAVERVDKLVNDTIRYCKNNKVKKLNVLNLGDLIHGIIHINARIENNMDITQQIIIAGEILANALAKLQSACPEIVYRSVVDNHSRAVANKNEHVEKENFNKIIDWFLMERLKNTKIKFDTDNIDDGIGYFKLQNGKKIAFSHGHQDNINQAFQHFTGAVGEVIDYVLLAHYHSEKLKVYQNCKVIINGSIVGTEQYALSKRLFCLASQTLLIFENENLLNISINLQEKKEIK